MAIYVVESFDYQLYYDGHDSEGVLGKGPGSEKIYLHLLDLSDAEIGRLAPRRDEHQNLESDRRGLPNEDWWIAVDGTKSWPKTVRPKVVSHCALEADGSPRPLPLLEDEATALRKAGVDPSKLG